MSVIGSNILAGASGQGGGYNLTNSLRFRSSAQSYLSRTFGAPTDNEKWTYSVWIKRGSLAANRTIMSSNVDGAEYWDMRFNTSDQILIQNRVGSSNLLLANTTAVYRDPSAWYHIVFVFDSNNATAANRNLLYVNGVNVTLSANSGSSDASAWNVNSVQHNIGVSRTANPSGGIWAEYDGYEAEINFIDGQALTPSSFGETSTSTGVWIPKKYTGTYGTNGFYLPFTDNSALTTSSNVGLGKDFSGNGNYFATNGISITAGSTYDSMTDVPTLTSATAANYCTLNPLNLYTGTSCANGNLQGTTVTGDECGIYGTIGMTSGKFYWESTPSSISSGGCMIGIAPATTQGSSGSPGLTVTTGYGYYTTGSKYAGSGGVAYGNTFTTSDVIGVALDLDNGKIWFGKQTGGTGSMVWQASGDPVAGTNAAFTSVSGTFVPGIGNGGAGSFSTVNVNFGQQPWSATPPTGFVALNTFNLPTPTIGATASTTANKYMNVVTWTGNGTSSGRSITGVGFQPDFVWGKARSVAYGNGLYDAVRGTGKLLVSNNTNSEATNFLYGYLSSFDSDGFSTTAGSSSNENWNQTNDTYVAWNWKANGAGVSNTAGDIASVVSANTSAGFSIVTYSANGTTGTVGHGLGVTPSMIIVKKRNVAERWCVFHTSTSNAYIYLDETFAAETANAQLRFGNNSSVVQPSSTLFTIGSSNDVNGTSGTYVAYCFAPVAGYSAFGTYTGNGSPDGTFVYTGFRPRFVMVKCSSNTTASTVWVIFDTSRSPYNAAVLELYPDDSVSEGTDSSGMDILSNGFKPKRNSEYLNLSGWTYIYMAFAESPFKYANAR
jgi:hypothetical protein